MRSFRRLGPGDITVDPAAPAESGREARRVGRILKRNSGGVGPPGGPIPWIACRSSQTCLTKGSVMECDSRPNR